MTEINRCFCAELSRDAEEEIFGTASTVDVWLLLEYTGRWDEEAFEQSELSPSVKSRLSEWLSLQPRSRLLFIRQRRHQLPGLQFYVALSREQRSVLYEFRLNSYDELLQLDIASVLREDAEFRAHISSTPIFLVCTHGLHDKCCAKFGRPVYSAMSQRDDIVVWQSSHVGGDRFAANVVCLPLGVYYGRVDEHQDVDGIVEACKSEQIYLERYRGRSCYSFAVQAAEYFIREQIGDMQIDALLLQSASRDRQGRWHVTFTCTRDGQRHAVEVSSVRMGVRNFLVCKAQEESELTRYELRTYDASQSG